MFEAFIAFIIPITFIVVFTALNGGEKLIPFLSKNWDRFLAHREKMAKIRAIKNYKSIPKELIEAWEEVNK